MTSEIKNPSRGQIAKWRWVAAGVAALLLSGLAILWGGGWISPARSRVTTSPADAGYYRFEPGVRIIHRIDYRSQGATDFLAVFGGQKGQRKGEPQPPGLSQKFTTGVRADQSVTVLKWKEGYWLAAVRLENLEVNYAVDGREDAVQAEALRGEMSGDLFIRVTPEGRILSVRFPPSMGNLSKSFAQTLLGITQFVFPKKGIPDDGRWELEEEDQVGRSVVLYERLPSDNAAPPPGKSVGEATSFRKTRLRYLSTQKKKIPGEFSLQQTTVPKGSLVARFQFGEGNLISMAGTEVEEFLFGDKRVGHAENSLRLEFLRRRSVSSPELGKLRNRFAALEGVSEDIALSTNVSREAGRLAIERSALGEATTETLMEDLKAADRSSGGYDTKLVRRLQALFRLYPGTCATFGKELARADPRSRSFEYVSGALAVVGHAKAQEALIEVIRARRKDVSAMIQLISTLADVPDPEPALVDTLGEIAFGRRAEEQVIVAAWYAMGSIARNLEPAHPKRAEQILDALVREMGKSPSNSKTAHFLSALGNSASDKVVPVILKHLADASVTVRAAAVSSLRLMDTPEVEPALLRALTADPEEPVRQQAATALASREMTETAFTAQTSAVLKDPSQMVRVTVLRTLARALDRYPKALSVIRRVAREDASDDVRNVAKEILERNPGEEKGKK